MAGGVFAAVRNAPRRGGVKPAPVPPKLPPPRPPISPLRPPRPPAVVAKGPDGGVALGVGGVAKLAPPDPLDGAPPFVMVGGSSRTSGSEEAPLSQAIRASATS